MNIADLPSQGTRIADSFCLSKKTKTAKFIFTIAHEIIKKNHKTIWHQYAISVLIFGKLTMLKRRSREEALGITWTYLKITTIYFIVGVKHSCLFNAKSQGSKLRSKSQPKSGIWQVRYSANMPEPKNVANMTMIHTAFLEAYRYFCVFSQVRCSAKHY